MEKETRTMDQTKNKLENRQGNKELTDNSFNDINKLKIYLDVDSKTEVDSFNYYVKQGRKREIGFKSLIVKIFSDGSLTLNHHFQKYFWPSSDEE